MVLHVYGVVAADASLPERLEGRAGAEVRRVADDELAALVCDVPDDARARRADLLGHAHLLEAVAAATTVVPMRFGVRMPDEDTVRRELLRARRDDLRRLLSALDGLVQLTVHAAYDEEQAMREVLHLDPALGALRKAAAARDDRELQVRLGQAVASGLATVREQSEALLVDRLRPHVEGVVVNEPHGTYDVANLALLVRRDQRAGLDAAVGELDQQLAGRMRLRYVGPQPPYAFLEHVDLEASSWA